MKDSIVLKCLLDMLSTVLVFIIPFITVKVINFLNVKLNIAKDKARTENEQRILDSINETVETVVKFISQTFVDTLKNNGKFNEVEQKAALQMALEKTKDMLTEEAKEFIMSNYGDINAWLTTLIEASVKTNKMK